jgi:hypothetical protein
MTNSEGVRHSVIGDFVTIEPVEANFAKERILQA